MSDVGAVHEGERLPTLKAIGEQAVELDRQDIGWTDPLIRCPCGRTTAFRHAFRCYFCHVYFCEPCAADHFEEVEDE